MTFQTLYGIGDWVRAEVGSESFYGEITAIIVRFNRIAYRVSGQAEEVEERHIKESRTDPCSVRT